MLTAYLQLKAIEDWNSLDVEDVVDVHRQQDGMMRLRHSPELAGADEITLRNAALARDLMTMVSAYDAIDPSGDLFRFGMSRKTAFEKQKSYDRVGINCEVMVQEFADADGLLYHWDAAVFRLTMAEEHGWTTDPYFDVDDFPKVERQPSE